MTTIRRRHPADLDACVALNRPDGDTTAAMWSQRTGRPVTDAAVVTRLCVAEAARGDKLGERLLAQACAGAWHYAAPD